MTSLVEIPRPQVNEMLRQAFVSNLLSIDGIKCSNSDHRSTWLEILGPVNGSWDLDRPFKVWKDNSGKFRTEGLSTCGLVAEGVWRRMNVDLEALLRPYLFGSTITRAVAFAKAQNAWITPSSGMKPEAGDYVVIGSGLKTHVLTCERWEGSHLLSIDGGQTDEKNLQAVASRNRLWHQNHKTMLEDREVQGWIDITRLPYRGSNCRVPAGYEAADKEAVDKYVYPGGYFVDTGSSNWEEWQNNNLAWRFVESERDSEWITLKDDSRNIWVLLPVVGGESYYAFGGDSGWTTLHDVTRET